MIISHSKKFIFIHNYKVAGTSIKKSLEKYNYTSYNSLSFWKKLELIFNKFPHLYSEQFPDHIKALDLQSRLPLDLYESYFKFGFVRNPWDWQVSLYNFMLVEEEHYQHELVKSFKNFDEYLDWRVNNELHLQKSFFYEGNKCLVNFIGKLENVEEDLKKICQHLSIDSRLPHLNRSRSKNDSYLKYYSQKSIDLVNEAFAEDIRVFGYQKPILEEL